jgi:DNA-binding transcriptional LysR family regulator
MDKKRSEPDWQDLRVFLALGRHGSLSAAARALSVNHSTILRRVRSLEATLGMKLVERRPESYVLTPDGTRTLTIAGEMEAAVQRLGRGEADGSPRGMVRVNAPPGLSQGFLIGKLAELPVRYPGLDIDLATDVRRVSLERHVTDIAVRIDRPDDGDFLAKLIGPLVYGFYGTASVCAQFEAGVDPVFVGFDEVNAYVPEAIWMARQYPRARMAFRANNQVAQAAAASAGAGLALLPHYIGRRSPELRLCPHLPVLPAREIWLLTRRQDRKNLAIRTVADYLTQLFADERSLFESAI